MAIRGNTSGLNTEASTPVSGEDPQRRRSVKRVLVLNIISFGLLGTALHFALARGGDIPPQSMDDTVLPAQVGEWKLVGTVPGWLAENYAIAGLVYAYEREDGARIRVTAAVGQERYGAFANIYPVHAQQGHEVFANVPELVGPPGKQEQVTVALYSSSETGGPFAFTGVFWDGERVLTSLAYVKVYVTLRRALGFPQPCVAAYFALDNVDMQDANKVASELSDFANEFFPILQELRAQYVESNK